MAGPGVVQDKIEILCVSDDQCLEGSALVSTGSSGLLTPDGATECWHRG